MNQADVKRWVFFAFALLAGGLGAALLLGSVPSYAEARIPHELVRRVAVFPVMTASEQQPGPSRDFHGKASAQAVDEAWWQTREKLTENRRFLVASKQFLIKSDAFLPRDELVPADAILLGRLLDAHALITARLDQRTLTMRAYDGGNGLLLWANQLALHPSLTISDQLPDAARRLIGDFIASVPYQGFQIVDPLIGKAVFTEGELRLARIDVGAAVAVGTGDPVQWVQITAGLDAPLFQGGSKVRVLAEGRIIKVEQGVGTIEILRASDFSSLKEFSLIRLPREAERLDTEERLDRGVRPDIGLELLSPQITSQEKFRRENRPLVTTLSWLASLATVLLLAF